MTTLSVAGVDVAVAEDGTALPAEHSPRPYLHPVRTLAGRVVTAFAPADHPWHAGLSLAIADVAGENFWGGNTYVHGRGYVLLDDHGRVEAGPPAGDDGAGRQLVWRLRSGRVVLRERRTLRAAAGPLPGSWTLSARSVLENVTPDVVRLGSPGTRGRPDAGYGGWTLRLADDFAGAEVRSSEGVRGEASMGRPARWVGYRTTRATVVVHARGEQDAPPWYVRSQEFPAVGPAEFFRTEHALAAGARLRLGVDVVVADGGHDPGLLGTDTDRERSL